MKAKKWKIHCIARCVTCGLEWDDYKTARQAAYSHAKNTGHQVQGETGIAFQYN